MLLRKFPHLTLLIINSVTLPSNCSTFHEYTNCSRTKSQSLCSREGAEFVDQYLERFGDATLKVRTSGRTDPSA